LTDNPKIVAPVNQTTNALILPFNDLSAVKQAMEEHEVAGILVEGIQGIGGIQLPADGFLEDLERIAHEKGALLILDEIQSGYGRPGKFFAHQYGTSKPDIITVAKGMGNGFPVGGLLISPEIKPWHGMLGTTFGGNHLACAAALAVLEVMEDENLVENAAKTGQFLLEGLEAMNGNFILRGRGLMIGIEFPGPVKDTRMRLLNEFHIFTGFSGMNTIRLLPPLCLNTDQAKNFIDSLSEILR
jgi:acetylornithine/N-succinyldiaminopimelate aminotransferase